MPVGRKELEKWSAGQRASAGGASGALNELIRAAHSSGNLNLSSRGLREVCSLGFHPAESFLKFCSI